MKKLCSAGAVLALVLIVAACGSGSSTSGKSSSAQRGSSQPFPELRLAGGGVRRVDVETSFDIGTTVIVSQVLQGLTAFDKDGRVIPALAQSVEQPDDTTYVYRLRDGVKFSDGKPLTVEDVLWSLRRDMGKDSQVATNYASVASITAQGSDAVVVKLKRVDVTWPSVPAFAGQIMEKAAAVRGGVDKIGTPSNLPIGTGPYRFERFSSDVGVTLVPNSFWRGPRPAAEKVTFQNLRDDSATQLALRSGDVDGAVLFTQQGYTNLPGVTLNEAPGNTETVLSMNTIAPPFNDVHVRRAIAYAVDREGINQAINGDGAEVNETLTPFTLYGNIAPVADVRAAFATLPRYDFDLAKARAELAQSRYPNGFTASIDAVAGIGGDKIAQAIVPDLAKIGIKLKIKPLQSNEWLAELYGPRDKVGFMPSQYAANYPDASSLIGYWLDPRAAVVNGLNSANYRNPKVGALIERQRRETDRAKRLQLITEIFRMMKEDVPYVPLWASKVYLSLSDKYVLSEPYSPWTAYYTPWLVDVQKAS